MLRTAPQRQDTPDEPRLTLFLEKGESFEEVRLQIVFTGDKPCALDPKRLRWTLTPHGGRAREITVRLREATPDLIEMRPDPLGARVNLSALLDYAGLKAGLYTLRVSPLPDAGRVEGRTVRTQDAAKWIYLPNPVSPPEAKVGQAFLCLPHGWEQPFPYRDLQGQPVDWRKVALRVWRLTRVAPRALEFAVEGLSARVQCAWEGDTVTNLPALLPIVDEPTVRQLRARYEGRSVWGYGGIGATALMRTRQATAALGFERLKPARLLRIRRIWQPWVRLPLGSAGYIGERNYTFYAHHPLVVQLQPLGKAVSGAGVGGDALDQLMDAPQRHAIGFYALCADAWDFERAYSLQNPQTLAKRWSARERRALQTGELAQGLSHEVVAWIWGWPSLYGTKQELTRRNEWVYEDVPFEATLTFRNGRLVKWHIPELP